MAALDQFAAQVAAGVERALDQAAVVLQSAIQQQLSRPGTGRYYGVRKGGGSVARALNAGAEAGALGRKMTKVHRASAPGEPPAPDTGTLKRSAFVEKTASGRRVGVSTEYAAYLEFGTPRIAPRPFMRPALAAAEQRLGAVFASSLTSATKGNAGP